MADASVAIDLGQIFTAGFCGLVALYVRMGLKRGDQDRKEAREARKEEKRDREVMAARFDAALARMDEKRDMCKADMDARFARKDDLAALKDSTSKNFGNIYDRLHGTEVVAMRAEAYAEGVEKTVSALCGGEK